MSDIIIQRYMKWRYKNTFLLFVSLTLFFYFADSYFVKGIISGVGELGYLGAFLTGIFFVSTFTVAPASIVLFYLAKELDPYQIALLAGAGAVIGDYIIFLFLKDKVFEEVRPVFMKLGGSRLSKLISTPYFAWFAPVIGALIIASPLPDEIGIGLLGISQLKNWQFIVLSFVLNSLGIFIIITLANLL
jgi:hypothetical protein